MAAERRNTMAKRAAAVVVVSLALIAGAVYLLDDDGGGEQPGSPVRSVEEMAGDVGAQVMRAVKRGYVPGRSGPLVFVPAPHSYITPPWDLRTLDGGEPETFTAHSAPWNYLARVPLILYGPGYVPEGRADSTPTTVASLAPTYGRLVGIDDFPADEPPLPIRAGDESPAAIVTVIIDGGGWNVLDAFPDDWPQLASLQEDGTSFTETTLGSYPSVTGPVHATFGTGRYPTAHGIPSNPWLLLEDPTTIRSRTAAERFDETSGNASVVAGIMYEGPHLGMIGRGAALEGGDADIAVTWSDASKTWVTNPDAYTLPGYVRAPDETRLLELLEDLDDRDGTDDGAWFGHDPTELSDPALIPSTPVFARLTGDQAVRVLRNEDVGGDEVTDFVWIEFKSPDHAGHSFNMLNPEVGDVLAEVDDQIGRLRKVLDQQIGEGDYVLAVSADHGQQPLADRAGGWRINAEELRLDLNARFSNVVERVTPVELQLDVATARERGVELTELAEYLGAYTVGDNIPPGAPGKELVPEAMLDDRVIAGAFPQSFIESMTSDEIASLPAGDFEEGDLSAPPERID